MKFAHRPVAGHGPFACPPSREAVQSTLRAFVPHAADDYARWRNHDPAPDGARHVSMLSGALRHRLILEREVLAAVLAEHGPVRARKFVEEVFWRLYFRGRLAHEPAIWRAYLRDVRAWGGELRTDGALHARWLDACEGRTGIACFDAWARELRETGYLHNHARMWFASIWIFTLRLPWALGADLFMRRLLDGDAPSNTLSWRWVGGLHTVGKHYLATAGNIERYTSGRFAPGGQLDEAAGPLDAAADALARAEAEQAGKACSGSRDESDPWCIEVPPVAPPPAGRIGLLITESDGLPESWPLDGSHHVVAVAALRSAHRRSPLSSLLPGEPSAAAGAPVLGYAGSALADAVERTMTCWSLEAGHTAVTVQDGLSTDALAILRGDMRPGEAPSVEAIGAWARRQGLDALLVADPAPGPEADELAAFVARLEAAGVPVTRWRRPEDADAWPRANAGYFRLRKSIDFLLDRWGL